MKLFLSLLLIINFLFAEENNTTKNATQLELFLFKIGFQALLSDVDKFGKDIGHNKENIESLQKKVNYILDKVTSKNFENKNTDITNDESKKISQLEQIIEQLQIKIAKLEKKDENTPKNLENNKNIWRVKSESNVRESPNLKDSKIIKQLQKDEKVEIKYCNRYDWCKLANQKGFIARYLLEKI